MAVTIYCVMSTPLSVKPTPPAIYSVISTPLSVKPTRINRSPLKCLENATPVFWFPPKSRKNGENGGKKFVNGDYLQITAAQTSLFQSLHLSTSLIPTKNQVY